MRKREIKIKTNKFEPDFSGNFIYDQSLKQFNEKVEIDLNELCAKFLIEQYNDSDPIEHYLQFPALKYLIADVIEFKFKEGHPGASKDPRKDDSRVLGQTICRYFVEKTFGNTYMANVGTLLDRKLPEEFSHISIGRVQIGDTPDFLFMDNKNKPCLAEAKGRRNPVSFDDNKFETWRKQFDRVEVRINGKPTEVKGYITEFVIANEDNEMPNSILYIEDPKLIGEVYKEGNNLDKLIILAHYERLLSNTYLNFVGNSLLSKDKLSKSKGYTVDVYKIEGIENLGDDEVVPLNYRHFWFNNFRNYTFVGITLKTLRSLINIARGTQEEPVDDVKYENFNSVFFRFIDGFVVCNSYLLTYLGDREI